jgi:hypothetical protein
MLSEELLWPAFGLKVCRVAIVVANMQSECRIGYSLQKCVFIAVPSSIVLPTEFNSLSSVMCSMVRTSSKTITNRHYD